MSAAIAGIAIGGASLLMGAEAQGDASDAARAQQAALNEQNQLAREQWEQYSENILPLEIEAQELGIDARKLAQQRGEDDYKLYTDFYRPVQEQFATMAQEGVRDQTDRATREAAETVAGQFDVARGTEQRNLERRGVRPDSGAYRSNERQYGLAEAKASSGAINLARENEKDRVENENFSRLSVASGRAPGGNRPTQASGGTSLSPTASLSAYGGIASQYGNIANNNAANAGGIVQGGLELAGQIYNMRAPATNAWDDYGVTEADYNAYY
jgi:hypothetical protein